MLFEIVSILITKQELQLNVFFSSLVNNEMHYLILIYVDFKIIYFTSDLNKDFKNFAHFNMVYCRFYTFEQIQCFELL